MKDYPFPLEYFEKSSHLCLAEQDLYKLGALLKNPQ